MSWEIRQGDALELLREMPEGSVDAIVTDPPYGLEFMGKDWDHGIPGVPFWEAALHVAKPGAHLVAFGGTRTFHRLTCAIEDAGWEIRDCLMWLYGSGFPKSLDVSKAIAKRAGGATRVREGIAWMRAKREKIGLSRRQLDQRIFGRSDGNVRNWEDGISLPKSGLWPRIVHALGCESSPFDADMQRGDVVVGVEDGNFGYQATGERWEHERVLRVPLTAAASQWQGWGTALKPAWENIILARKPGPAEAEWRAILASLTILEARLCLLLSDAKLAALHSPSSPDVPGLLDSARWSADARSATWAALSEATDTSRFELAALSCLSIVSSWSASLGESCAEGSTFTTETRSSTTTDPKTLGSLLSALTLDTIIGAALQAPGSGCLASPVARAFNAAVLSIASTRELSALAPVISDALARCQDDHAPAFRPDWRPIILARKPLLGTVAANVLEHGTGALNVDRCRIGTGADKGEWPITKRRHADIAFTPQPTETDRSTGRWPANLVLDEEAAVLLDAQSGETTSPATVSRGMSRTGHAYRIGKGEIVRDIPCYRDTGGASRFFYTAKASSGERHYAGKNAHPTVKPVDLMRWLCRLVTPPGGLVLDPFTGSGSTGIAALAEGFRFLGIERDGVSVETARRRIAGPLFAEAAK